MAKSHALRLYSEGIDLDIIRRWLFSRTTRQERDEILAALPHRVACAA
ncbi:hypothetical protein SAMN06273572_108114 [Monaibacterium marinum]|uniref:Uncharacterized protein n=1 Tax=Pontivivens marinum TaxID=1690039 RepID=A0A2C9CVL0_9RHOB|nr:hypothetical protein [Monaibacterium marinum]SOH95240.1 hypothetical protein SAMN06273572_108114 [Monaibacterium marinum]